MRKRQFKPADPFSIFKHATHFVEADEYLRKAGPRMGTASTSMVLTAFAIELLLKCILVLEKNEPSPTHRLDVLFRQISHKRKRRLVDLWDREARRRITPFCQHNGLPTDLPNAIVKCGSAFDELRYHYEDPEKATFYLGDLSKLLIIVISEIRPDWVHWVDQSTRSASPNH